MKGLLIYSALLLAIMLTGLFTSFAFADHHKSQYMTVPSATRLASTLAYDIPVLSISKVPNALPQKVRLVTHPSGYEIVSSKYRGIRWSIGGLTLATVPEMESAPYSQTPYEKHNVLFVPFLDHRTTIPSVYLGHGIYGYIYTTKQQGIVSVAFGFNSMSAQTWTCDVSAIPKVALSTSKEVVNALYLQPFPLAYRGWLAIRHTPSGFSAEYDWTPLRNRYLYFVYVSGRNLNALLLAHMLSLELKRQ